MHALACTITPCPQHSSSDLVCYIVELMNLLFLYSQIPPIMPSGMRVYIKCDDDNTLEVRVQRRS